MNFFRDLETYNNLSLSQKETVDRWDKEKADRALYLSIYQSALIDNNKALALEARDLMCYGAEFCEHGRRTISTCIDCYEIEEILQPEILEKE